MSAVTGVGAGCTAGVGSRLDGAPGCPFYGVVVMPVTQWTLTAARTAVTLCASGVCGHTRRWCCFRRGVALCAGDGRPFRRCLWTDRKCGEILGAFTKTQSPGRLRAAWTPDARDGRERGGLREGPGSQSHSRGTRPRSCPHLVGQG